MEPLNICCWFVCFYTTFAVSLSSLSSDIMLFCEMKWSPFRLCNSTACDSKQLSSQNDQNDNVTSGTDSHVTVAPVDLRARNTVGKLFHFGVKGLQHPGIAVEWNTRENVSALSIDSFRISTKIKGTDTPGANKNVMCEVINIEESWHHSGTLPMKTYSLEMWPVSKQTTYEIEVCARSSVASQLWQCSKIEHKTKRKANASSSEWSTTVYYRIASSRNKHNVHVGFDQAPAEYSFETYDVSLLKNDATIVCNHQVPSTLQKFEVIFEGLCPGLYKIWMEPSADNCRCRNRIGGCEAHCTTSETDVFLIPDNDDLGSAECVSVPTAFLSTP